MGPSIHHVRGTIIIPPMACDIRFEICPMTFGITFGDDVDDCPNTVCITLWGDRIFESWYNGLDVEFVIYDVHRAGLALPRCLGRVRHRVFELVYEYLGMFFPVFESWYDGLDVEPAVMEAFGLRLRLQARLGLPIVSHGGQGVSASRVCGLC